MAIELARSAGFCFGVKRVMNMINEALDQDKKICTLGHIIHNESVIEDLRSRGAEVIEDISEANKERTIVIRSHGVGKNVYDSLKAYSYIDGTCPFVAKIHRIVSDIFVDANSNEIIEKKDVLLIIIGNQNHPEIKGIEGHSIYEFKTIPSSLELKDFLLKSGDLSNKYIKVVFQTTYDTDEFQKCVDVFKGFNFKYQIFDTICNETKKRQTEAREMSRAKDLMVIVGGKNSSNTQKLVDVCKQNCQTIFINQASDLDQYDLKKYKNIGVTAGASTPYNVIEEVVKKLKGEIEMKFDIDEKDFNFEKEIDNFINVLSVGDQVSGTVIKVSEKEAQVDIGNMYDAYLPLSEASYNPSVSMHDIVKIGDVIKLTVTRIDDVRGEITLSKKRMDRLVADQVVREAFENKTPVEGVVTKVLKDGVIASVYGKDIYIHESQTGVRSGELESLLKKVVKFKVTQLDEKSNRVKGSIKDFLKEKFWEDVKVGDHMTGVVRSLTNFGAFVDLGGEDGLIFISELSWNKIKHPSEVLKVGQIVETYIKDIDYEKRKLSLGYKKEEENPWKLASSLSVGDIVDATIVSITPFGAFAQIAPSLEGLIHISEISETYVKSIKDHLSVGQSVSVRIVSIDLEKKRIGLSLKLEEPALQEINEQELDADDLGCSEQSVDELKSQELETDSQE